MSQKSNFLTIFFFISVALISFMPMCIQETPPEKSQSTRMPTPEAEATPSIESPNEGSVAGEPAEKGPNAGGVEQEGPVCENCHFNPSRQYVPQADKIEGHLNGVKYCSGCHAKGGDVKEAIAELHHAKYSDCLRCHTDFDTTKMKCENCHGYPDPFKRSNGNLLDIHMNRGISCKNCHGNDFLRIHQEKVIFPPEFTFEY